MQQPFGRSGHDTHLCLQCHEQPAQCTGVGEPHLQRAPEAMVLVDVAGGGGNAVGQQLLSITGVSEVAVVALCTMSRQPRPSRVPGDAVLPRAAWLAVSGLANSRGSRRLAEPEASGTPPSTGLLFRYPWLLLGRSQVMREGLAEALLRGGLGCCGSPSLSGATFGEGKGLTTQSLGLSGSCRQELSQVILCLHPEPLSPSLLLSPQWCMR